MPDTPPDNARFSLVYMKQGETVRDDPKMRLRIARVLYEAGMTDGRRLTFSNLITRELGVPGIPRSHTYTSWDEFFLRQPLNVVFDLIWLMRKYLADSGYTDPPRRMLAEVQRIFSETQAGYTVNRYGSVRYIVDQAFEANRAISIFALQGEKYRAAMAHIEGVDAALTKTPMDGRAAIRAVFDAAENIFKQISKKDRLTRDFATAELSSHIAIAYPDDSLATRSQGKTIRSFGEWVDAAHFYRHESGQPAPHQPPEDVAVLLVSQGISYVRWLAKIHRAVTPE